MSKKVIQELISNEETISTRLFMNGGSQAVRIPAKWRFDSDYVEVKWDEVSESLVIRALSKEELKASFIAQVKALTPEEKEQIRKDFSFVRDQTRWTPNPKFAEGLGTEK
jgi:antitoxin VapB